MTGRFAQRNLARIGPHSLPCCHETSWQYSVAASGRSVPGRRLGHHRTGAVRHHHRHSTGHTGVQNGGTDVDPVRQDRGIRRWRGIGADQHRVVRAGRRVDGARLRVRRTAELHYHHRHSVWHPVVQDGQTGAVAVWFANLRSELGIVLSLPSGFLRLGTFHRSAFSPISLRCGRFRRGPGASRLRVAAIPRCPDSN